MKRLKFDQSSRSQKKSKKSKNENETYNKSSYLIKYVCQKSTFNHLRLNYFAYLNACDGRFLLAVTRLNHPPPKMKSIFTFPFDEQDLRKVEYELITEFELTKYERNKSTSMHSNVN